MLLNLFFPRMIGTILNVAGILVGGLVGLTGRKSLSAANESFFKVTLAVVAVVFGLRLTWVNLSGSFAQVLKQLLIVILALMLGKLVGRLLRLQRMSNRLGHAASERIARATPANPQRFSDGFKTCTALFCAAPLGILGALLEGLSSRQFYPLAVKAVMDGLATMGFVSLFGRGVLFSAFPVLAVQGTLTLASARFLEPFLSGHDLLAPVNATGGLLIFSVALVMLGLKRIELADYLPSLAVAPLLTWLWR